jgi:hypothetical protein
MGIAGAPKRTDQGLAPEFPLHSLNLPKTRPGCSDERRSLRRLRREGKPWKRTPPEGDLEIAPRFPPFPPPCYYEFQNETVNRAPGGGRF